MCADKVSAALVVIFLGLISDILPRLPHFMPLIVIQLPLNTNHLCPGSCVGRDHYMFPVSGVSFLTLDKVVHMMGMLAVEFIFITRAVGFNHHAKHSLWVSNNIQGKQLFKFKRKVADIGIQIKHNHIVSCVFASNEFCTLMFSFSGVGVHHPNGMSKHAIRMLSLS
jgi:hypothetical protein